MDNFKILIDRMDGFMTLSKREFSMMASKLKEISKQIDNLTKQND